MTSSSRSVRLVEAVLGVALLLVVVAGVGVLVRPELWPFRPKVALVGDSITATSAAALRDELVHSYHLDIEATPGYRTDQLLPAARQAAADQPEQVVINLGTNDAFQGWPVDQSEAALRELVGLFPAARCVHLVTVNERILDLERTGLTPRLQAYNQMLARVAASRPGTDLIDWTAAVDRYSAAGDPSGPFTFDSVHPLPPGQHDLAQLYHRALDACPQKTG